MSPVASARAERSTADLVHEVLRSAASPLTLVDVLARVNAIRSVRTRNPSATVRGALSQGAQLVSLGDGRYGYLPRLIEGSVLRLPLDSWDLTSHRLIYPHDVQQVLWPSFFDIQKRKLDRPTRMRLPSGDEALVPLEFFGAGAWGGHLSSALVRYLVDQRASAGDALIIQVVDGEAGVCDVRIDSVSQGDELALPRRNRDLADAAHAFLRGNHSRVVPIWDIIVGLLANGAYRAAVPPDPLEHVLSRDKRFVDSGLSAWMLASTLPSMRGHVRDTQRLEAELAGMFAPIGASSAATGQTLEDLVRNLTGLPGPPARRGARTGRARRQAKRLMIYQLKVRLKGTRPPIWRRLLVRSDTTLALLHEILQAAMGWFDCHLHVFMADGVEYGVPDAATDWPIEDERLVTLADIAPGPDCRVHYQYDFGDDWGHELLVEKVLEPEAGAAYPRCLKGRRARPPEDVGGVWGYARFLDILADPDHPDRQEWLEWAGGTFDAEAFNLAGVNESLRQLAAVRGQQ